MKQLLHNNCKNENFWKQHHPQHLLNNQKKKKKNTNFCIQRIQKLSKHMQIYITTWPASAIISKVHRNFKKKNLWAAHLTTKPVSVSRMSGKLLGHVYAVTEEFISGQNFEVQRRKSLFILFVYFLKILRFLPETTFLQLYKVFFCLFFISCFCS